MMKLNDLRFSKANLNTLSSTFSPIRPEYLENFYEKLINWEFVESNLD